VRLPEDTTPARPDPSDDMAVRYVRSYLIARLAIGVLGLLLPVVLLVGDRAWFVHPVRDSLSAYYHSGTRDVFVGVLCMTGFFLITYMLDRWNWDNVLTVVAGLAAIGVAWFPTTGEEGTPLTPLQEQLGATTTRTIHFACAAVFILLLAAMSWRFAVREGARPDRDLATQRRWHAFHLACAFTILGAVAYIAVTQATNTWDEYSLLIGEIISVVAFGLSWLAKGAELEMLRGRPAQPGPAETVPEAELV
jgi:hypothetical protein